MKYALTLAALSALIAMPAVAQERCGSREEITDFLAQEGEHLVDTSGVMADGGDRVELYATDDQVFWTVVLAAPTGTSCILERWSRLPREDDEQ